MKIKYFLAVSFFVVFATFTLVPSFRKPGKDVLIEDMDPSMSPKTDFFQYANGGWIKRNPIPKTESNWGIGNLVEEDIKNKLKDLNERSAGEKSLKGSDAQKIGDFYKAGMDSIQLEKEGIKPLMPFVEQINQVKDLRGLWLLAAKYRCLGVGSFFRLGVSQDEKNSEKMAVNLGQGGLGLPNRDYYLKKDARTRNIQVHYLEYLKQLDVRLNPSGSIDSGQIKEDSQKIYELEKFFAWNSKPLQDLRDPQSNYHKMNMVQLGKLCPHLDWKNYLLNCGLINVDSVIVGQPEFLVSMDRVMDSLPLSVLKNYMKVQLLNSYSGVLSNDLFLNNFNFYSKILRGQTEMKPRWKRVIEFEEGSMGMLLGRLFIHEYFSEQAKLRYVTMVDNVLKAFEERIHNLTWMSPKTKVKALVKLHSVHKKVGYPDKWKDYTALEISSESLFKNVMAARNWSFKDRISKFGKPVDRTEWGMTPQTYNAYYNPSNNEIVLPAAQFLVPGMKDEDLDDAIAYGYSAASTIGHEITHGFDDEGRQFDEKGNLKDWWTPEDTRKFTVRAQKMVDQFNAIVVLDSLHINGKACLGENIADLGGILIGFDAFKKTDQYKSNKKINGLTPTQRFFMGYALGWLGHEKDQSLSVQILTDVHAPGKYRVNAPMQNVPEFYTAFGIQPGDGMYREEKDRVRIW